MQQVDLDISQDKAHWANAPCVPCDPWLKKIIVFQCFMKKEKKVNAWQIIVAVFQALAALFGSLKKSHESAKADSDSAKADSDSAKADADSAEATAD